MRKNIIVISGGPGFGKTSLVNVLGTLGLKTGAEAAREIIAEQFLAGGEVLPWLNIGAFQKAVMERRISFWQSVADGELAFCDRAIPDQLAFARFRGVKPSVLLQEKAGIYEYYNEVLVCPPWKEIYTQDEIRQESFREACRLHELICEQYLERGYCLVELPKASIKERIRFVRERYATLLKQAGYTSL
jgi:predicted ATPase